LAALFDRRNNVWVKRTELRSSCDSWGWYGGVVHSSFLLGYDAMPLGNRFPTPRRNVVLSSMV